MKFQFCGHINCPEWLISEISVLTKITAVKMKLIFTQLILYYLENADITPKVAKLLNGTGLDHYEMHSVIATLKFILENSVTFNVDDLTLNKQLIDLGLPKQNVESISKTYKSSRDKLSAKASQSVLKSIFIQTLQFSHWKRNSETFSPLTVGIFKDWYLSTYLTGNIKTLNIRRPTFVQIQLSHENLIQHQLQTKNFIITNEQLDYLIYQLQSGLQTMQNLQKAENERNQEQEND